MALAGSPIARGRAGGYYVTTPVINFLLEKCLAAGLLVLASPLFVVIPILIKLQDGGAAYYLSRRLGKNKKLFDMYKFRTLVVNAEEKVGSDLLNHSHRLELPIGKFLRDTRLDELPQLVNVLKGEMSFFGPRPERPSVYERQCRNIPGYDKRFAAKPGVIGYAQLFTPHGTPKKIRTLIDNMFMRRHQNLATEMGTILFAVIRLGLQAVQRLFHLARRRYVLHRAGAMGVEQRTLERVRPKGVYLDIRPADGGPGIPCLLGDINEECMLVYTTGQFHDSALRVTVDAIVPRRSDGGFRRKRALCRGEVFRSRPVNSPPYDHAYVLRYTAASPLNAYLIDKYVLHKSIL